MIATTDFFMPIVDDPFDFGRIAATNAISDVYAMGGKPLLALGILGWPLDKLGPGIAGDVVAGAQSVCRELGLALAGGHSIDAPEPIFGLAVNGLVDLEYLKLNKGAQVGDLLFLIKPLGVGFLTTAEKQGLLASGHQTLARETMLQPNQIGMALARVKGVHAMTDVTGFGLAGHLSEICQASGVAARIDFRRLPRLTEAEAYRRRGAVPGGTHRNRNALGTALRDMDEPHWQWLCDPQTSGGLLLSVHPSWEDSVKETLIYSHGALAWQRVRGQGAARRQWRALGKSRNTAPGHAAKPRRAGHSRTLSGVGVLDKGDGHCLRTPPCQRTRRAPQSTMGIDQCFLKGIGREHGIALMPFGEAVKADGPSLIRVHG